MHIRVGATLALDRCYLRDTAQVFHSIRFSHLKEVGDSDIFRYWNFSSFFVS